MKKNNYEINKVKKQNKDTDIIFDHIQSVWKARGGTDDITIYLKNKAFFEKKYHVETFIMHDGDAPVGMGWIELTTQSYGNVTFHVLEKKYVNDLICFFVENKSFDYKIIEIVHLEETSMYKDALYAQPLIANIRQRMSLWLENRSFYIEETQPFTFSEYQKSDAEWAAELSIKSHSISKDYKMYNEMIYVENRIELEKRVWSGWYGDIINPASLVLHYNNQPVGYCVVVSTKCWGYKKVPWIFDICVDPSYHGQGIGKALSYRSLNKLIEMNFPLMGLAVTLSNQYAISLYEKLGFQLVDVFYEFTKRD